MAKIKSKLIEAANRVWRAFLAFGPVDDGRPEGDEFDSALMHLRLVAKTTKIQTEQERAALVGIVGAADECPEPIHYKVREAIAFARRVLEVSDMEVEE